MGDCRADPTVQDGSTGGRAQGQWDDQGRGLLALFSPRFETVSPAGLSPWSWAASTCPHADFSYAGGSCEETVLNMLGHARK